MSSHPVAPVPMPPPAHAPPTWESVPLQVLPPPRYPDDDTLTPTAHNHSYSRAAHLTRRQKIIRTIRKVEKPIAFAALYASVCAVLFVQMSWGVALPAASDELDNQRWVGWLNTGFLGAFVCSVGLVGKVTVVVSPSYVYYVSSLIFFAGVFLHGLNRGPGILLLARILAGIGASGVTISSFRLAQSLLSSLHLMPQFYLSVFFASSLLAAHITGPTLGPLIADLFGWRAMYQMMAIEMVGLMFVMLVVMRYTVASETKGLPVLRRLRKLKVAECVVLPVVLVPVLVMNAVATKERTNDFHVLILLVATGALIGFCAYLHYQFGHISNIPRHFIAKPVIWSIASVSYFTGASLTILNTYLPLYFISAKDISLPLLPSYLIFYKLALASGTILSSLTYLSPRPLAFTLLGTLLTSLSALSLTYYAPLMSPRTFSLMPILSGLGLGISAIQPLIQTQFLPEEDRAPAYLLTAFFAALGGTVHLAASNAFYMQRVLRIMGQGIERVKILETGFSAVKYSYPQDLVEIWKKAHIAAGGFVLVQVFVLAVAGGVCAVVANLKIIKNYCQRPQRVEVVGEGPYVVQDGYGLDGYFNNQGQRVQPGTAI